MRNDFYPAGTVRALLKTAFVTPQTKQVLNARLNKTHRSDPLFFSDEGFSLAEAVCACLFPQNDKEEKIALAVLLEDDVANGRGKGWRYNQMPPMKEAITKGLNGIEEEAKLVYGKSFPEISFSEQENLLTTIQTGKAVAETWKYLPSDLFFTELVALLAELYYSHPFAKEEIGEVAFADVTGWQHLGLNVREDREPQPLKPSADAAV